MTPGPTVTLGSQRGTEPALDEMTSEKKIAVVTGGNSGIGMWTVIGLAREGYRVVFTSRNPTKGAKALEQIQRESGSDEVTCLPLDLADFDSIRAFADEVLARCPRIDVFVANAGLVLSERHETKQGLEMTFGVNHVGHFLLTDLLRERLIASAPSRIVVLASDAHRWARGGLDFDDLQNERGYSGFRVYGESKLANILFTRELARRLEGTGVTANAVHPGVVATGFAGDGDLKGLMGFGWKLMHPFLLTPEKGARTSLYVATSPQLDGKTGGYYAKSKPRTPLPAARDDAAAKRLWKETEALIAEVG